MQQEKTTMEHLDFIKLIGLLVSLPKETEWIEYKHNFHSKEEIGEQISALSNSAYLCNKSYGYLVFGVEDETRSIVGTDLYAKQKKVGNEELESWLSTRLNPRIDFEIIDDFNFEERKHICIFKIPATINRPVSFLNESYIRINSTTRKLRDFPAKEAKIWKGQQNPLESLIVKRGLDVQDIIRLLSAETYFDLMRLPFPQNHTGVIERYLSEKFIVKGELGYDVTKLGALLLAKHLSDFDNLKRKCVRVIVYKGKNKIETLRERIFEAGYAVEFSNMVAWINSQLPANEEIKQALREEKRMYPEVAIREIVANMIIHQDFATQGFPMVEIYSDRIEISNPGIPLISIDRFIDEYQSRNDDLADVMRRMGFCEEKGSGMDKVIFNIELFQLPPLQVEQQENRTCITIFAYKKFGELNKDERILACYQHACLKYISNDRMTNKTLRIRLGIDENNYPMASRIIRDTIQAKIIKVSDPNNLSFRKNEYIPYWG